jgi:cathepsin A (carboxypeptidase C)
VEVYAQVNTCGAATLDHNARLQARYHIPLVSIIIGNGLVSPSAQFPALYDTSCSEYDSIPPLLNETECAKMAPIAAQCELLADACAAFPDDIICGPVGEYCEPALKGLLSGDGHHPLNLTLDYEAPTSDAYYPTLKGITDSFAVPQILKHLDINKQTEGKAIPFNMVSGIIGDKYSKTGGTARTSIIPALTKLINDPSVEVRIYVGINDWIANTVGVRRYLDNMRLEGYLESKNEARLLFPWKTKEGKSGGMIKRFDGLWHVSQHGSWAGTTSRLAHLCCLICAGLLLLSRSIKIKLSLS